jgi:hypothetical protein
VKGVATHDRRASTGEESAFHTRLQTVLDTTKRRLARLSDNKYELRVMTIRSHDVKAHTRKTFEKIYFARKLIKRSRVPTDA